MDTTAITLFIGAATFVMVLIFGILNITIQFIKIFNENKHS